jgi:EmrB/QacA subfamily drug resistance transporter
VRYEPYGAQKVVGDYQNRRGGLMTATATQVGLRSERGPILISLMLATGLVAIDSTIIATAVPSVVANLGGFAQFPWLFSVYLLAQAVSVPIYGKLADLFGRKPIMLLGIGLFLLGSILCGVAWSMPALIAFRAVQGLGAGGVQPMSLTIAGDIYSTAERGRVQGYLASVWGTSAVVGPALGGVISEYANWRLIFLVNVPLCLIAGIALTRSFSERVERRTHKLDYAGATVLATGCTLIILGLLEGGEAWAWRSPVGMGVPAAGLVLIVAFIVIEWRAREPVLPLWVFRRRILVSSNMVSLGVGAVLIGLTSYIPTYVQGVLGTGPLIAGFALSTLTVGWPITSSQSSRLYLHYGYRATGLIGAAVVVLGAGMTALLTDQASVAAVGAACFIVGAGLGLVAAPTLIAAQSTVGWSDRGVVTATNMFSRSIGSAVGIALFGAIANTSVRGSQTHSPAVIDEASHHVFLGVVGVAVLLTLAVTCMPRTTREHVEVSRAPVRTPEPGTADPATA